MLAMEYHQSGSIQGDLELAEVELKKLMEGSDPSCSDPAKSKPTNREHYDNKIGARTGSLSPSWHFGIRPKRQFRGDTPHHGH